MENDINIRNREIRNGAKLAFIFMLINLGLSQVLDGILPSVPGRICSSICMLFGTLLALRGKLRPEKGKLMETHSKMTGIAFVVILGAFLLGKLLSELPPLLLSVIFIDESNAAALQDIVTIQDNLFLSFIFLGLVTPVCEEIIFRGCIGSTYKKYGIWFGMIMSSVLFSLYHCNVFQLFSTFLPGVVLFYVAMNYSIIWSMVLHLINNGILAIGTAFLQKYYPGGFFTKYGEYILEGIVILAAFLLMKRNNSVEKVKQFMQGPENEKGCYKAALGNVWFVLLVLATAVLSILMFATITGKLPAAIPAV